MIFLLPVRHGLAMKDARCEGLTIATSDRAFAAYDVPILPA